MSDIFLSQLWRALERWFYTDIANWTAVMQIAGLLLWTFATRSLAHVAVRLANHYLKTNSKKQLHSFFDLSIVEIIHMIFMLVSLWVAVLISGLLEINLTLVETASLLFTAWVVVRLISGLVEHSLWARFIGLIVWSVAALMILGIYETVIKILASYSFAMGAFKLSLLTLVQGILTFSLIFWFVRYLSETLEGKISSAKGLTRAQKVLFSKLAKIGLISVSVVFGLNLIGIDLTAIAILGSAVGFGIAFGLQKVFSNLISGLILLMDRSIQPGDVIAVGDTYGEVVDLEARYVSVVTRDGKAHLIPNETLITEKVENWSYNDRLLRLRIPVSVDYDSDLRLVEKILLEAAQETDRIVTDPVPKVLLIAFEDSSIKLELRAWIADPMNGMGVPQSDVLFAIWDKFKELKIQIPFNQLDVHITKTKEVQPQEPEK